ncbi:hypothetical protein [Methylobacterium sp. CM6257]
MRRIKASGAARAKGRLHLCGALPMRAYLVTFYKIVCDDAGHDHRVPQGKILIRAYSDVSAEWQAKALLCERACVIDWRLRADSCEVAVVADVAA